MSSSTSQAMNQVVVFLLLVLVLLGSCQLMNRECPNVKTPLNFVRKRRHLAFPDNSDVVLTASILTTLVTHVPSGWNLSLEIDVLYPLPDLNFTVAYSHRKRLHHRQKKELWKRFEDALSLHNVDGRACVFRSICEAKVYLAPPGKSLVHDILRTIFTAPEMDQEFREEIQGEYDEILTSDFCDQIGSCPVSLLHFILILNEHKY